MDGSASSRPGRLRGEVPVGVRRRRHATGPRATHTYGSAGTYRDPLATQDDRGRWTVTTGTSTSTSRCTSSRASSHRSTTSRSSSRPRRAPRLPVKFAIGGGFGLGVLAAGSPASTKVDCASGVSQDEIEQTVTAGGSSLQAPPPPAATPTSGRRRGRGPDKPPALHADPRRRVGPRRDVPVPLSAAHGVVLGGTRRSSQPPRWLRWRRRAAAPLPGPVRGERWRSTRPDGGRAWSGSSGCRGDAGRLVGAGRPVTSAWS